MHTYILLCNQFYNSYIKSYLHSKEKYHKTLKINNMESKTLTDIQFWKNKWQVNDISFHKTTLHQ